MSNEFITSISIQKLCIIDEEEKQMGVKLLKASKLNQSILWSWEGHIRCSYRRSEILIKEDHLGPYNLTQKFEFQVSINIWPLGVSGVG